MAPGNFRYYSAPMSDNRRKELRTQGRYKSENHDSSYQKPRSWGPSSGRSSKKKVLRGGGALLSHESCAASHDVKWDDGNDGQHFSKLKERPAVKVIKDPGFHILSDTENGESRIYFEPDFIPAEESLELLETIYKNVRWNEKNIVIHDREYPQPRLVAWYGPLPYSYSGVTLKPRQFPDVILKIKRDVECSLKKQHIDVELNSVLLNLYRDGKDSVAWHSDDELSMGICPTIASVSLGEVRRFEMRHTPEDPKSRADAEYVVHLNSGSLIVMDGVMQLDWQHRVPKEFHDKSKRINLTFRTVYSLERVSRPLSSRAGFSEVPEDVAITFAPKIKQESYEFQEESFPSLGESMPQRTKEISSKSKNYDYTHQKIDPPRRKREEGSLCNSSSNGVFNNSDSHKIQHENWNTQVCEDNGIWETEESDTEVEFAHEEETTNTSQLTESRDNSKNVKNNGKDPSYHRHNHHDKVSNWLSQNCEGYCDEECDSDVNYKGTKDIGEEKSIGCSYEKMVSPADCGSGFNNSHTFRTDANGKSAVEPDEYCMLYDSSNNSEQAKPNSSFGTLSYEGEKVNSVDQLSENASCSRTATHEKIMHDSQVEGSTNDNKIPFPDAGGHKKGETLADFVGSCYWYPPLDVTDDYKTECKKLNEIYQYVYTNWHDIPFTRRDRKELEVLLLVIEDSGPLRLRTLKSVTNEMINIVQYAERRQENENYYIPRNSMQFPQRRFYHNSSNYKKYYRDQY